MTLTLEPYAAQIARWPQQGRVILAQFDRDSVIVYQAYSEAIGHHAVTHQRLGGSGFSFSRMSWIKPNFLWMMYRSGWASKLSQEMVLAIRIAREGFNTITSLAVSSSFDPAAGLTHDEWKRAVGNSEVRLQWDPDHDPTGAKCERRAIQLGLRGSILRQFVEEWTLAIEDMSELVHAQRQLRHSPERLVIPREDVYPS